MRATRMRRILSGWRIKALKVTLRWAGRSDWRQLTRTIQRFGNGCVQKLRTADGRTLQRSAQMVVGGRRMDGSSTYRDFPN